ncbi:MAG: heme-binding domain-containing protein [Bacteroidia bacterium]
MSKKKKIGIVILVILVIIQFIRPTRNKSTEVQVNDITVAMNVPADVMTVLKTSCYDCHSNNTNDMWYMNIQPIGLWVSNHIEEGKEELNFSEWVKYKPKRKAHKMEEIAEMVNEDEMPMSSYTIIHGEAKLSAAQKKLLVEWAMAAHDSLKAAIPVVVEKP